MDFNVFYLRDRGSVELLQVGVAPWVVAKITAFGIVEDEEKQRFVQAVLQHIEICSKYASVHNL
jgi:hypothetical protein